MPPLSMKGPRKLDLADATNRLPTAAPGSAAIMTNKEPSPIKALHKASTSGSVGPTSRAATTVPLPPTQEPSPKQALQNMSTSGSALSVDAAAAIYRDQNPSEASKEALRKWWGDCYRYPEESTMPCCRLKTHQLKHPEDTENCLASCPLFTSNRV